MALFKKIFGSSGEGGSPKSLEAKYADAVAKLADTMVDLYIDLIEFNKKLSSRK